jgi:hypothetical protein
MTDYFRGPCVAYVDRSGNRPRLRWRLAGAEGEATTRGALHPGSLDAAPQEAADTPAPLTGHAAQFATGRQLFDLSALDALEPTEAAAIMLRAAAEIEHELMLEYLFAASSLHDADAAGVVTDIAVEEMGHLLTVNNLMLALGHRPYFGRGGALPGADPFPFRLRPADQITLASFTAAESPDPKLLQFWERAELRNIFAAANQPSQFHPVQRVGVLYEKLMRYFQPLGRIGDGNFKGVPDNDGRQASADEEWCRAGQDRTMLVRGVHSVADALAALQAIAGQGEGFLRGDNSHFVRFRRLYRGMYLPRLLPSAFPGLSSPARDQSAVLRDIWRLLGLYSPRYSNLHPTGTSGTSLPLEPLARLIDLRYRHLLVTLYDIFAADRRSITRAFLIDGALRQMRYVLGTLLIAVRQEAKKSGQFPVLYALQQDFDPVEEQQRDELRRILCVETKDAIRNLGDLANAGAVRSAVDSFCVIDADRASQSAEGP